MAALGEKTRMGAALKLSLPLKLGRSVRLIPVATLRARSPPDRGHSVAVSLTADTVRRRRSREAEGAALGEKNTNGTGGREHRNPSRAAAKRKPSSFTESLALRNAASKSENTGARAAQGTEGEEILWRYSDGGPLTTSRMAGRTPCQQSDSATIRRGGPLH